MSDTTDQPVDALPEGMTNDLLALLRCPLGRSPLRWDAGRERLVCECGVGFPMVNGYANLTGDAGCCDPPPDGSATLPCGARRP